MLDDFVHIFRRNRILSGGVIVGVMAFGLRLLGVLACSEDHVHNPTDCYLLACLIASGLIYFGAMIFFNDD